MNGAKQVGAYGIAPLVNGMGLFIATPSYNGEMTFNVTSTREILPDMEFFVDCLEESLNELKSALKKPARKKTARKKTTRKKSTQKIRAV